MAVSFVGFTLGATLARCFSPVFSNVLYPGRGAQPMRTRVGHVHAGRAPAGERRGTALGVIPNIRPKLVVNEPTLRRPTAKQMSATERSVIPQERGRALEPPVEEVPCGGSPTSRRNSRLKCAGDSFAARARHSTSSGSR